MNQIKIGKFIAQCRKDKNLTQMQLAEKLNITDRAISKWENGKGMPDSSIMLQLCDILGISVNELLSGEIIEMENLDKKTEELLLEMAKKEEMQNKRLMTAMWTILIITILFYMTVLFASIQIFGEGPIQLVITLVATLILLVFCFIALKFEVDAGYYQCKKCRHKFVPTYKEVVMAMHMGTTRYLKCPECNKRSWCKKVMK